jgi:type I restriction enzyme S subunit
MTAKMKDLPVMKDSGVPWLGKVPEHWGVVRNGRLFTQRNQTGYPDLPVLEVSLNTGVRVRNSEVSNRRQALSDRKNYKRARAGDITYNMMRMWQGAVGVAPVDGLVSPAYVVARPLEGTDSAYFVRLFRTPAYMGVVNQRSRGIVPDRNRLYWEDFKRIHSPVPPPQEQLAIIRFLDHVEGRIRRYIQAKNRLMQLLEEEKQAIIHHAVTRGLDPDVRLRPSGVEGLGDIPEHWHALRLKALIHRIDQGVSPQAESGLATDGVWGVIKSGCVNRGTFRETEHKRLPDDFSFDPELVLKKGDVLISRASGSPGLVGSAGRVDQLNYSLILSDKIFRPVFNDRVWPDFMVLAMSSRYYRQQVERAISGAEGLANNLPVSALRRFYFAVPPVKEQRRISEAIHQRVQTTAAAIENASHQVSLLREYRTRLIADVVTGKLDVRDAAARLPDVTESTELIDEEPDDLTAEDAGFQDDPDSMLQEAEA